MVKVFRQRYLLFEVITEDDIEIPGKELMNILWAMLRNIFGIKITYKAGLWLIRWDPKKKIGILRMDNITQFEVIATLALLTRYNGKNVIVHTRKMAGTIKKTLKLSKEIYGQKPAPFIK